MEGTSLARFDCAESNELRAASSIGDAPGYYARLIPEPECRGLPDLFVVAQLKPLSRALVQLISVSVSQLELDVFVIGFHRFGTYPKFLGDPARPKASASQRKDMQFAVGQVKNVGVCCRMLDHFVKDM